MAQTGSVVGTESATPDVLQKWEAAWSNTGDPSQLLDIVTDDIVFEDVAIGDVLTGTEALQNLLAEAGSAVPDFSVSIQTSFATDSMAAAEYVISGTQSGDLPYLASSGKSFRIRASSVFEMDGGKIRRESRYYDAARFLNDLGGLNDTTFARLKTPAPAPGGGV